MEYYVKKQEGNVEKGIGTYDNPFQTISEAAKIAKQGDTIIVGNGVYRENVSPENGGLSDSQRIIYKNAEGQNPVISGAEVIEEWQHVSKDIWKTTIDNEIFGDYNPFDQLIFGDWYNNCGHTRHTGEVFINGKMMYECDTLYDFDKEEEKEERNLKWHAKVWDKTTEIWGKFLDHNPNEDIAEITVRQSCFFPKKTGLNYITVTGFTMKQAATQWAPPTAFQGAIIGPHWSKGWIIENCIISDSKCAGISLGKRKEAEDNAWTLNKTKGGQQTQTEVVFRNLNDNWNKENIGSHIVRNNLIYNCGQTGIVGHLGCAFSQIYGNHIHHANIREDFTGAEIAGIKLHGAIDTIIKDNVIHDCMMGLWLDWEAQGVRVSKNAFFNNKLQDIMVEVCHGPCLVDNNILLSENAFYNLSQGTSFVHNLIAARVVIKDPEDGRFTMYHMPHDTAMLGVASILGGDDKFINNIFVSKTKEDENYGTCVYNGFRDINGDDKDAKLKFDGNTLPVNIHDNLYLNECKAYNKEKNSFVNKDFKAKVSLVKDGEHYYLENNLDECMQRSTTNMITSDDIGVSFQSRMRCENPDGTKLIIDTDFMGNKFEAKNPYIGAFAKPYKNIKLV